MPKRKANESAEEREERLNRDRERKRQRRANETPDEKSLRLQEQRNRNNRRLLQETASQRSQRLAKQRDRDQRRLRNETDQQRLERLQLRRLAFRILKSPNPNDEGIALRPCDDDIDVLEHHCGEMTERCQFCGSTNFDDEKPKDGRFNSCGHKGKVVLAGAFKQGVLQLPSCPTQRSAPHLANQGASLTNHSSTESSSLMSSPGPPTVGTMKAMEPAAAPMITVPEGVLKEFISNSPSPPTAALVSNETSVDSPKVSSQTRTPSPDLPNARNDSALPTDTPNHVVNGVQKESESTDDGVENCNVDSDVTDTALSQKDSQLTTLNTDSEKRLNGTVAPSLKRPSEEGSFQDLKKVRVFSEEKGKSIESSVQEFNKHLDQESKKLDEDEIMCLSSVPKNEEKKVNLFEEKKVNLFEEKKANLMTEPVSNFDSLLPKFDPKNESVKKSDLEVLTPKVDDALWQEKSKLGGRLRKLSRKELEKIILRLFCEKTLYQCELGRQKILCEKLETTLEASRKKTAQFHKEVEDLKKVTNRLCAEQAARKGQFVAPIRIKRSVGIQAAPHIINKGLQHAQSNSIKTISPRAVSGKGSPGTGVQGRIPNNQTSATFQAKIPPNHSPNKAASGVVGGMILSASQPGVRPQPVGGATLSHTSIPMGPVSQQASPIGAVRPAGQMLMMTQPSPGMMQTIPRPAVAGQQNILTGQPTLPAPGTLVKVPVTGSTQLVAIPQTAGVVLLPNASAGTALVVSQVSGVQTVNSVGNPVVAQARTGPLSTPRVTGTSFRPVSATTTTGSSVGSQSNRHPAPLPRTLAQQVAGLTKKLPPQPTLKLSHKENSIVLSWTMLKNEDHETIASYQLYAYQEGNSPPNPSLWKKVGSVKALELPMACTLTQFMPGHVYHFAVRAVDIRSRLGPFSEPRSIRLEKK
ncbi:activating transcription factor 7-interacting protein 1-like isoform X3 [Macrobrachium rosenbergii]|uniref:activating transcription factor 7-interacting protein 1-like isoform X3 n=1 Tax=Macrobrachium rosenbergii TaxID=79674 RepID=UPI0034D5588D